MKAHNQNNPNTKQMITEEIHFLDRFSTLILIVFIVSAYLLLCSYDLKSEHSIVESSVQHMQSITEPTTTINP